LFQLGWSILPATVAVDVGVAKNLPFSAACLPQMAANDSSLKAAWVSSPGRRSTEEMYLIGLGSLGEPDGEERRPAVLGHAARREAAQARQPKDCESCFS
jgi:hypothetical protein